MKLKIKDKSKVRRNLMVIALMIIGAIFLSNVSFSNSKIYYKTIYTSLGDTLWSIAKNEQKNNSYYKNKDIRNIIYEIKQINNLASTNISSNQKLQIPIE